jgi:putative peptide zinc metalloprotease protein
MANEPQKLASPPSFRKRLKIFRVGSGDAQGVFVKDEVLGEEHTLEPWQFFVLEVLFGCETFEQLGSVFQDRFGKPLTVGELDELFALVEKHKWFSLSAAKHPLVVASQKRAKDAALASAGGRKLETANGHKGPARPAQAEDLPAGVHDALGLDDGLKKRIWKLFDPRGALKLLHPLLMPLRHAVYLLPLLAIAGIGILIKYSGQLGEAVETSHDDLPLLKHLLLSMVTVNLLATLATSLVAHHYRATVSAFGIAFHLGIVPRFIARIGHVRQLSRRERIWLHATPLLVRLTLFNVGVLFWWGFAPENQLLSSIGVTLATASFVSLLITANPLIKSNAYHLISAYLDEPYLRGKSSRALLDRFRGKSYQKVSGDVLAAYALASGVFFVVAVIVLLYLLERVLEYHVGGPSIALVGLLAAVLAWALVAKFRKLDRFYTRSAQFQKWRERAIPDRKAEVESASSPKQTTAGTYVFRVALLAGVAALFLPYRRELGAPFVVVPQRTQELTSPLSGIVEELAFDGGELLEAGTVIGSLSHEDDQVQVSLLDAKILAQEAVIAELRSRPLVEEVRLAENRLETAVTRARLSGEELVRMEQQHAAAEPEVQLAERKVTLTEGKVRLAERQLAFAERNLLTEETRARFSAEQFARMQVLHAQNAASLEDLEDARQEHEVDRARAEEQRANIDVMRTNIEVMTADVQVMRADLELMKSKTFEELEEMRQEHELDLKRVEEETANLELVKVGAKPEQVAAAEAQLKGWQDEREYYREKIGQSIYSMPFHGTLVATRLREKQGSFIEKGELLALVEDTQQVLLQLEVPEPEIASVHVGAAVRARLPAYFEDNVAGSVTAIESTVTEQDSGPVVRVSVLLDNREGRLKSGMSGFAKIACEVEPLWKVLSPAIVRFFKVEVWSWLP